MCWHRNPGLATSLSESAIASIVCDTVVTSDAWIAAGSCQQTAPANPNSSSLRACTMAPRIPKGQKLPSTDYQEDTLSVHDCVLINPDSSQATTPYVGKIMHIIQPDDDNEIQLYVNWFYKPEEAFGGRKTFHGEKEVFISDHFDVCSLSTVISKCRVLSLPKYQELKKIEDGDYFARFTYRPAVQLFEPPRVPVFCRCEMPYNPDQFMVCCDACTEWYHPECLNTTKRAVQAADKWKCPDCERYSQMAVAAPGSQVQDVIPASKRTRVEG